MDPEAPRNPGDSTLAGAVAVAVVEDDRSTREALRVLLDGSPGFACAGAYASVEEALVSRPRHRPDVVLLDINLPGMSGVDGVQSVAGHFGGATVLMLTVFEDEDRIFRSLCNGADGYVLKKTPPGRLLEYVQDGASGGAPMSPEIARKVVGLFRSVAPRQELGCRLSPQETRLLGLLADGHSYQSAAATLDVSLNTVRNYIRTVYDKLHVHTRSEAVSKALRAGLI